MLAVICELTTIALHYLVLVRSISNVRAMNTTNAITVGKTGNNWNTFCKSFLFCSLCSAQFTVYDCALYRDPFYMDIKIC